jgi:hypothetical protein
VEAATVLPLVQESMIGVHGISAVVTVQVEWSANSGIGGASKGL